MRYVEDIQSRATKTITPSLRQPNDESFGAQPIFTVFRRFGRAVFAALAVVIGLLFGNEAQAACNYLEPDQVAFFTDANYRGACVMKTIGDYPSSGEIGLPNDSISSIRVGSNAQVVLCKDNNFQGDCIRRDSDVSFLNDRQVGNDAVSSAKVQLRGFGDCMPGNDEVSFYTNANFLGDCIVKTLGEYANSSAIGLLNDSISSVRLGANTQVILCTDDGYGGDCIIRTANIAFLNDDRVGNDRVSSAKVQRLNTSECQPGANQASFFEHADFLGYCVVREVGQYASSDAIGLPNDSLSSFRVGANVQVVLCNVENYTGDCILRTGNERFLNDDRVGNDSVSSAKVQLRGTTECSPQPNQASLFMHADYVAPCVTKSIGDYPNSSAIGIPGSGYYKPAVSSIKLTPGVQVCGCTSDDYQGTCTAITESTPFLGKDDGKFSSVRVQPAGAICVSSSPTLPTGNNQLAVYNCHTSKRTIHLWTRDITLGETFIERATVAAGGDGCPSGVSPTIIPLADKHLTEFIAVDPGLCDGTNDPNRSACQRSRFTKPFLGDEKGQGFPIVVE